MTEVPGINGPYALIGSLPLGGSTVCSYIPFYASRIDDNGNFHVILNNRASIVNIVSEGSNLSGLGVWAVAGPLSNSSSATEFAGYIRLLSTGNIPSLLPLIKFIVFDKALSTYAAQDLYTGRNGTEAVGAQNYNVKCGWASCYLSHQPLIHPSVSSHPHAACRCHQRHRSAHQLDRPCRESCLPVHHCAAY